MLEKELLKVNISQFDEEEAPAEPEEDFSKYISDGELDVESLVNDYKEPNEPVQEISETSEEVEGDPTSETPTDSETETETETEETKEKRTPDAAFAEMRRKAEQNEEYAKWVQGLAEKQGFSDPKELISEFEKQQMAKEAQEKGVPVDVYERLQTLEKENQTKDQQMFAEKFNREVEETKDKYNLNDDKLNDVFQYMARNGYVDKNGRSSISFEDAYILADKETLLKDAEERGRQSYLEEKQKLQKQATPNVGTNANDKTTSSEDLDYSKEGIFNKLSSMGIEVD